MGKLALSAVFVMVAASSAAAMEGGYFSVKAGGFFPNGKDSTSGNSLQGFDSGYNTEVALGYRPESYAAIELGTGFYSASSKATDSSTRLDRTVSGIPVTATAKAILDLEKLELFAGAGLGYYFTYLDNKIEFLTGGIPSVSESSHGGGLGYHVVVGGDYKLSDRWRLGADFKWFEVKADLELTDTQNNKRRTSWDLGGSTLNLGVKYLY